MKKVEYRTPKIEEFCVGFEFERAQVDSYWDIKGWKKEVVTKETDLKIIKDYINYQRVEVK